MANENPKLKQSDVDAALRAVREKRCGFCAACTSRQDPKPPCPQPDAKRKVRHDTNELCQPCGEESCPSCTERARNARDVKLLRRALVSALAQIERTTRALNEEQDANMLEGGEEEHPLVAKHRRVMKQAQRTRERLLPLTKARR